MRIDFRMTALVTAVTVVLTQIYGIYITLTSNPTFPWTLVVQFVIGLLLFVPFPVLLFLLYKTGTIPEVAGKLRNLAIVIALVYGAHLVVNNFHILYLFHHRVFLLYALNLISGIVYLVFLVALSKQDQGKPAVNERQARLVWDAARVTLLAAWGSVAMRVVGVGVSTVRYERMLAAYHLAGGSARWHFHLRHAGGILSLFCSAIAAWILYKGLSVVNAPLLNSSHGED